MLYKKIKYSPVKSTYKKRLIEKYGRGYSYSNLYRMLQINEDNEAKKKLQNMKLELPLER
ncbi:MAG: hypothetical protein HFJ36_02220 [Clostridia bacterium]|nr:hypothetical protein [Clostridia bacterium]